MGTLRASGESRLASNSNEKVHQISQRSWTRVSPSDAIWYNTMILLFEVLYISERTQSTYSTDRTARKTRLILTCDFVYLYSGNFHTNNLKTFWITSFNRLESLLLLEPYSSSGWSSLTDLKYTHSDRTASTESFLLIFHHYLPRTRVANLRYRYISYIPSPESTTFPPY